MTIPAQKIELRDLSYRELSFRDEPKSERKKKPFIFKGYKTEEDRINETIKNNRYLFNFPEEEKGKNSKTIDVKEDIFNFDIPNPKSAKLNRTITLNNDELKYMLKNDIILQPHLRFKARTDLERVYDALDGRIFKDSEKNVLERQLKNIGLYSFEKPKDILRKVTLLNGKNNSISKIEDVEEEDVNENNNEMSKRGYKIKQNPLINEEKKEVKAKNNIYGSGNLYYIPKHFEYKPWRRRLDLNSEAERILSEYHVKTHFKAAEEIAENKMITKKEDKEKVENMLKKNKRIQNSKKDPFNFERTHLNEKETENFYIPYEKNENPFTDKKKHNYDKSTLKALSNIAFKVPDDTFENNEGKENEFIKKENVVKGYPNKVNKKQLVDEHNVLIDGEIYYKDTQFDIIANKVLNNCKVYKHKSKNNDTNLKKGDGKLMITHGLSINQFEKKYNLEE